MKYTEEDWRKFANLLDITLEKFAVKIRTKRKKPTKASKIRKEKAKKYIEKFKRVTGDNYENGD